MLELFSLPFMQRAVLAGVILATVAGYYSVFVVQRGMGFLASGLAHSAFGGVALGILLGTQPLAVAIPFTLAVGVAIKWTQERGGLAADTVIGVFFSVSMALGVVFLAFTDHYNVDAFTYLFGSLLFVGWIDVAAACALGVMALATIPLWPRWAYATVDRELATADGVPVRRDDYLLLISLTLTVVIAMKIVGMVLIGAFAVIPAAAARLVCRRLITMTFVSVAIGAGGTMTGIVLSVALNLPTGPAIILVQAGIFFVALAARRK